jgi:hypothetical protein
MRQPEGRATMLLWIDASSVAALLSGFAFLFLVRTGGWRFGVQSLSGKGRRNAGSYTDIERAGVSRINARDGRFS